jgi:leucyl-tRNA synthetase
MGGFACSSWYFLRFTSPDHQAGPFDPAAMAYWMPVDLYVGGTEHAVLHLLYARFWTKVLADEGILAFREPFSRLVNQGQLHGPDGQRMSKSRGNVIVPDEMVKKFGADALRVHGLFMAPFDQKADWNTDGMVGARRFLTRVWNLYQNWIGDQDLVGGVEEEKTFVDTPQSKLDFNLERERHITIQIVTERMEKFRFNTMISCLMEFVNILSESALDRKGKTQTFQACLETLLVLLAPTAPFIAEELWAQMGRPFSIHQQPWPVWDETLISCEQDIEIPIQVDGRRRGVISIYPDEKKDSVVDKAIKDPKIQDLVSSREISRTIYVPGKILNIVTRDRSPSS